MFLEISQNSQEETCATISFLIKLQVEACNYIKKETLAKVFSRKFCEVFKNTFFHRVPPVAASEFVYFHHIFLADLFLTFSDTGISNYEYSNTPYANFLDGDRLVASLK